LSAENSDMTGRVCLVTGANSGIGKATAIELARQGASVVMVCRDRSRGEAAQAEIQARSGSKQVDLLLADLSSQEEIHRLASEFQAKYDRLHVLVNNAGVVNSKRKLTIDGLELTFALNHLGYFLLTNLLLAEIKASGTPERKARIVNVSSEAQAAGVINFGDLQLEKNYGELRAYAQSKLANILFTYELARRLKGTNVTANVLHPGVVRTNFAGDSTGLFGILIKLGRVFEISAEKGARTPVYLASSPEVEGISGQYFSNKKPRKSSRISYDQTAQELLWHESARLTGLEID
jgi:NAD(P)-dependent dehydrogenase (short-subunit alcohol dehydrogenase family)